MYVVLHSYCDHWRALKSHDYKYTRVKWTRAAYATKLKAVKTDKVGYSPEVLLYYHVCPDAGT